MQEYEEATKEEGEHIGDDGTPTVEEENEVSLPQKETGDNRVKRQKINVDYRKKKLKNVVCMYR